MSDACEVFNYTPEKNKKTDWKTGLFAPIVELTVELTGEAEGTRTLQQER